MVRGVVRAATPCLQLILPKHQAARAGQLRSFRSTTAAATGSYTTIDVTSPRSGKYDPVPTTKPASARPIDTRKSQLIRTYTSLLRSTPLILFFQHSNLTAVEWAAVRRELKKAVDAVPEAPQPSDQSLVDLSSQLRLQVVRTNMFDVALRIVEFHNPALYKASPSSRAKNPGQLVHDLSETAFQAIREATIPPNSAYAQLQPLMVGPIAALVLPAVSPAHLAAALSVLSPVHGMFPAPSRKKSPGYHDPICQNGLAKLMLVGGRIEGKVFDQAGVNWVGTIEGGLDGLRAQLVATLQGAGLGVTAALEGGSRNIWLALESRRVQLDGENDKPEP
ncbi:proteinrelated to ribosomal protein YmL11 precursor, mitochondrial [Pochonia chlamydosporia 170]|uniref:Proteinrelated to ribosomal protein YmL11, mitochondrial n=1 Tax=Pochonia chlamydosporia 170 TaxID=1380566 RepID=A0A179FF52_METCM|nr:proteinrelated to ribosomal protein YmL11 precursor, mitochondrial [Pochonia chlamydosporia 170]OAQ64142.1 proteinrelated to ribosomal protein YmL11 precursor, mitochondrial [Pochonia chlamydosporia 170]